MTACFICPDAISQHSHHVVPRSEDGDDGPQVPLCARCHQIVHDGARAVASGKSAEKYMLGLPDDSRARAQVLIQVIVAAKLVRGGAGNPRPLLSVRLEDPVYMQAIDAAKTDRGFSSRADFINALARELARGYGMLSNEAPETRGKIKLSSIRKPANS